MQTNLPLVAVDPADVVANTGVNTGVSGLGTANTPGDETLEDSSRVDNGATAVTLARVLATSILSSAEHVASDIVAEARVVRGTLASLDDGDGNLSQVGGQAGAAGAGSSPVTFC